LIAHRRLIAQRVQHRVGEHQIVERACFAELLGIGVTVGGEVAKHAHSVDRVEVLVAEASVRPRKIGETAPAQAR
jgi:hypothetical protein